MNDGIYIAWIEASDDYVVFDAYSRELFRAKSLIECEDYLLGRNMRTIYEPE